MNRTTEIADQTQGREVAAFDPQRSETENMLAAILQAVTDPRVDATKLHALIDATERIKKRHALEEYTKAFMAMQLELPTINKRGAIMNKAGKVQSKYSKWEDIQRVITPILHRHGFALSHRFGSQGPMLTVEAVLQHVGGHVELGGPMPLDKDTTGAKNSTQGAGSATSYGRRYTTVGILNLRIEGEDDDGRTASERESEYSRLEELAHEAASRGLAAYKNWFQSMADHEERLQLTNTGLHEKMKAIAAEADKKKTDAPF